MTVEMDAPDLVVVTKSHPVAEVPDRLFVDDEAEATWRGRFSATRISLADPARDAPDRASYVSNASGAYQLYDWDIQSGSQNQATDRPDGTTAGGLSPDGETLFWFDDHDGDEFGSWRRQPFGSAPGSSKEAFADVPPGYSAGLALGRSVTLVGFSDDDGTRIHQAGTDGSSRVVYAHPTDAGIGDLSRDETIWVLAHSEHGDNRYPALRAYSVADGQILGELDDTPGKGLNPVSFSPVTADQRLLVTHERRGRDELLIWDIATGAVTELTIDLAGDLDADFYPDGAALVILATNAGRTTLHRYDLDSGELTDLPAATGVISGALARPDGSIWYRWSSAEQAARLRKLTRGGDDSVLLLPPGQRAADSQPVQDLWTEGPGGMIHSLVGRPVGSAPLADVGLTNAALPTVFFIHGGPNAADEDLYDATRAAWLDAGFCVVQVNYRGSTGYGSTWRDAISARLGHTELADIAAVQDHLIATGAIDGARCVVAGYSWGGYLTLLALGAQPSRWAVGVAGVPVADYIASYEDEMEPLRAFDRALFGGSPTEVPSRYVDSSPITYVDQVRAPVLVLAGENDPRCPIRQIDNYLDALAARHAPFATYRYEAGHGSMVVAERIRQVMCEINFARTALGALDA